jgi:hypothetical protein
MVWDPMRITRRSWPEVVAFYRDLEDRNPDFQPLRELAEQVSSRPYGASLGAATSGTALLVTPAAVALMPGPGAAIEAIRLDVEMSGSVRLSPPRNAKPAVVEGPVAASLERALRAAGWIGD